MRGGDIPDRLTINRRTLIFLIGMALTNFAVTMPVVLIPVYIRELGASITQLGLFFTISMIFPILVKLFGGWLSDVVGRLQVILIGSVTGVLTFAVYAFAPTWETALLAPALMAITSSLTIPAFAAYIADITPEPSRGRMFGVSQTVYRASGVVAPVVGGVLAAAAGFRFMFGVATVAFAFAAVIFLLLLRTAPSLRLSSQKVSWESFKGSFAQMWALFVAGGVIAWVLIIDGVRDIAMRLSIDLIPVYLTDIQGVRLESIGFMDGIYGLALLLTLYPAGWLVDRTSERTVIALALLAGVGSRLVLAISGDLLGFTFSFALQGIGFGLFAPSGSSLISKAVPQHLRGVAYGLFATSISIFSLPSPWIGSQIWELFGPRFPFLISVAIGSLLILPAWFKLRLPSTSKRQSLAGEAVTLPTIGYSEKVSVLHARFSASVDESLLAESAQIVQQHGGTVSLTEQAALTATFGISPNRAPPQVSALLATHAALSLLEHVQSANGGPELPAPGIGIGIDTGEVTVGPYLPDRTLDRGIRIGQELTLTGDLVTTARRLQSRAADGELWVSVRTHEYLSPAHHQFTFELDGTSEGSTAYRVLGRTTDLDPSSSRLDSRS
ncbi:MAG: MFS transporter [Anaerolineales bacterium]